MPLSLASSESWAQTPPPPFFFPLSILAGFPLPRCAYRQRFSLDEVSEPDLHAYPNLAAFFYRTLKPGSRPLDPDANALLSPADGKILQSGRIEGGDIEQVKGMTYSVDALLGKNTPPPSIASGSPARGGGPGDQHGRHGDEGIV